MWWILLHVINLIPGSSFSPRGNPPDATHTQPVSHCQCHALFTPLGLWHPTQDTPSICIVFLLILLELCYSVVNPATLLHRCFLFSADALTLRPASLLGGVLLYFARAPKIHDGPSSPPTWMFFFPHLSFDTLHLSVPHTLHCGCLAVTFLIPHGLWHTVPGHCALSSPEL